MVLLTAPDRSCRVAEVGHFPRRRPPDGGQRFHQRSACRFG